MTTSKPNAPGVNIPAGDIEFFDKIMTPLLAGDYDITLSQSLDYGSGNESFQKTQSFSVQAPRFKLPVADVQSVYPANGSTGKFEHKLPQIVMNKRALPWEHVLEPGDNSGAPWMALLVFSGPEILTPQNSTNPPTETFAASFPLGQVRNFNNGCVLGPAISHLDYGQTDEETVSTIDISTDTFLSVVPHLAGASTTVCELCSLAHVREVVQPLSGVADILRGPGDRWSPFLHAEVAALRETYADDMFWLTAGASGLATLTEDLDRTEAEWPTGPLTKGQGNDIKQRRMAHPR